jgi:hypothetical protein
MRKSRVPHAIFATGALLALVVSLARAQAPVAAPTQAVAAAPGWIFEHKKGEELRYRTYIRIMARTPDDSGEVDLTVRSTSKNTTRELTPEGNVIWEQLDEPGSAASLNGMPLPPADEVKPVTITFGKNGVVLKRLNPLADPGDQTQRLLPLLSALPVPPVGVKAGDSWKTDLPNPMLKNKIVTFNSTLVGNETVLGLDCLKVELKASFPTAYGITEKEYFQLTETYWLDAKTRQLVRSSYVVKNAMLPFPAKSIEARAMISRIIEGQNDKSDPEGEAFMKPKPK